MHRIPRYLRDSFHVAITPALYPIGARYDNEHYYGVTPSGVRKLGDQWLQSLPLTPLGDEDRACEPFPESNVIQWEDVRDPMLQNLPPKDRMGCVPCTEPMTGAGTRDAELRAFASAYYASKGFPSTRDWMRQWWGRASPTPPITFGRPTRCPLPFSKRDAFCAAIAPALDSIGATFNSVSGRYHGVSVEGLRRAAWAFRNDETVQLTEADKQEGMVVWDWDVVWWKREGSAASTPAGGWAMLGFNHATVGPSPNPPFIPISTLSDVLTAHPAARARRVRLSESGGVVIAQHVSDWMNELSWSKGYAIGTVAGDVDALNRQLRELADKAGWAGA